jgi:hypothetical protein
MKRVLSLVLLATVFVPGVSFAGGEMEAVNMSNSLKDYRQKPLPSTPQESKTLNFTEDVEKGMGLSVSMLPRPIETTRSSRTIVYHTDTLRPDESFYSAPVSRGARNTNHSIDYCCMATLGGMTVFLLLKQIAS